MAVVLHYFFDNKAFMCIFRFIMQPYSKIFHMNSKLTQLIWISIWFSSSFLMAETDPSLLFYLRQSNLDPWHAARVDGPEHAVRIDGLEHCQQSCGLPQLLRPCRTRPRNRPCGLLRLL